MLTLNVPSNHAVCPDGLAYAAGGTECLSFEYTISPNPLSASDSTTISWDEFASRFNAAVNEDGALYDALVDEYPETDIVGLGSPGKGESSFDAVMAGASESNRSGTESETDSGLAAGAPHQGRVTNDAGQRKAARRFRTEFILTRIMTRGKPLQTGLCVIASLFPLKI